MKESNDNIPKIIESSVKMQEPNTAISIHAGQFKLKNGAYELVVNGVIEFVWIPNKCVQFSGNIKWSAGASALLKEFTTWKVILNDFEFGDCFWHELQDPGANGLILLRGTMKNVAVSGDKSIEVDQIIFSIPNFKSLESQLPVKKVKEGGQQIIYSKRILLEDENYLFAIDKCFDYNDRQKLLEKRGGYLIQYYGELKSKKGSLNFSSIKDTFYRLNIFLTFLNGQRTSAIFLQGFYSGELFWTDYSHYLVDQYKYVKSWLPKKTPHNLDILWDEYCTLFKSLDNRDFLISAINWYVEANKSSGISEGSIIMAQAALELIYNWWIVEDKKLIFGRDSKKIHASNKFRLLLSQLNILPEIPDSYRHLQQYKDNNDSVQDACDAIVEIRNAIVHSQYDKRKKLSKIDPKTIKEALELSLYYIEMSLLGILKYDGISYDRRLRKKFASENEQFVPWSKKKE